MAGSVTIVDYGVGNLASIVNMIRKAGGEARLSSKAEEIHNADRLLLPGVGAFDACQAALFSKPGLVEALRDKVHRQGCPLLGICVGMQLLCDGSEEGQLPGLSMIPGMARRFDFGADVGGQRRKIPHMGWSIINPIESSRLCNSIAGMRSRFYFVHSFHVICGQVQDVAATANYGIQFVAALERQNVFGVQFHPEKSHRFGLDLFGRFLRF